MEKGKMVVLVLVVIGLILILNFLSWNNAKVVEEIPENSERLFLGSDLLTFLAGLLIVGIVGIWIGRVVK